MSGPKVVFRGPCCAAQQRDNVGDTPIRCCFGVVVIVVAPWLRRGAAKVVVLPVGSTVIFAVLQIDNKGK